MKFELEPDNRGLPDAALLEDLCVVARKLGKDCVTKDEYNEHGRLCASSLQKRFGSWCKAHELAGLKKIRNYDATAEDCLADIRRVAEELGKTTLPISEYKSHGKFSHDLISRRCGSWRAAVERLGLTTIWAPPATEEELFENLEHIWEASGRQPRRADFVKPFSNYSYSVYARRFGSLRKALETFVASFEENELGNSEAPRKEAVVEMSAVALSVRHRTSRTISWRVRFLVMRRDDFKCRICGTSPALKPGTILAVDHVVPWTKGGETMMDNLQTLCVECNGGKSDLSMTAD